MIYKATCSLLSAHCNLVGTHAYVTHVISRSALFSLSQRSDDRAIQEESESPRARLALDAGFGCSLYGEPDISAYLYWGYPDLRELPRLWLL